MALIQNRQGVKGKSGILMNVTGIPALDMKFNNMDKKVRRRIGTKALRRAAKVELHIVKNLVPVDTGKLKKSFSIANMNLSRRARMKGIFGVKVAPRKSRREEVSYINVVEKGTRDGSRAGTFFLKRSAHMAKWQVKEIFVREMETIIKEEEQKAAQSGAQ
tara:strand:+ start:88 stop:570 length:483 start_codon:yes stop_codon:yes gene_type:complete